MQGRATPLNADPLGGLERKAMPDKAKPLVAVLFVNWFAYAGVAAVIGGSALYGDASPDSFVLRFSATGATTEVSRSVWLVSLLWGGFTVGVTPSLFALAYAAGGRVSGSRGFVWSARGVLLLPIAFCAIVFLAVAAKVSLGLAQALP